MTRKRTSLYVDLDKAVLGYNSRTLNLDESLVSAALSRTKNLSGLTIELNYQPGTDVTEGGEGARVYEFLQSDRQTSGLEVCPAPDEPFPGISISGDFKGSIIGSPRDH